MWLLEKASKSYKKNNREIKALDNISLKIEEGEYISIIGPSGSGKSSLLLVLGGMLEPTQGKYLFQGQSLYDLTSNKRALVRQNDIGFVFQNFHLIPYLSAIENVQIPLTLNGKNIVSEKRAEELLQKVGLSDRLDHKPYELSIGQQQRVALARMMANDPTLILADEPTGNLDPQMAKDIIGCLEALNKEGKTVIIVTHDMNIAKRAQRIINIEYGSLV